MISRKLGNTVDTLEAHAEAGQLDRETFALAVSVLRSIVEEVEFMESHPIPDHALDGPQDLRDAIDSVRRQFEKYRETGLTMEPPAVACFAAIFAGWCEIIDGWGLEEPPARRHAGDPGVVDFCAARACREPPRWPADTEGPDGGGAA